jgi:uncharacterized RDD family membrane protein YckC
MHNTNSNETTFKLANFWNRAGAYLIDIIIVGGVSYLINGLNILSFKSFAFYLVFALLGIAYKPFLESYYGATIGKMVLKLKVTDENHDQIDITTSILRSLILIFPTVLYIPLFYTAFNNPEFQNINEIFAFSQAMAMEYSMQEIIGNLAFILLTADLVFLLTDLNGRNRSLHDRIANTQVIKEQKNVG